MSDLLQALRDRVVLGDGAMGTELIARGMPIGHPFGLLNVSKPDLIHGIHHEYLAAGAELHRTNTFTANRLRLRAFGLEANTREFNVAGARLARRGSGKGCFVAGSVGPLSDMPEPPGERRAVFREQIEALAEGGCDAIILETFTDLDDLRIAMDAARSATVLPVIAGMSFPKGGGSIRTLREMEGLGPDVIGVNCTSPLRTLQLLEEAASRIKPPLMAFPSAGHEDDVPGVVTRGAVLASRRLANSGVRLVGGCCGVGPQGIATLAAGLVEGGTGAEPRFPLSVLFPEGGEVTLEHRRDPETDLEFFDSRHEEARVLDAFARPVAIAVEACGWKRCELERTPVRRPDPRK